MLFEARQTAKKKYFPLSIFVFTLRVYHFATAAIAISKRNPKLLIEFLCVDIFFLLLLLFCFCLLLEKKGENFPFDVFKNISDQYENLLIKVCLPFLFVHAHSLFAFKVY